MMGYIVSCYFFVFELLSCWLFHQSNTSALRVLYRWVFYLMVEHQGSKVLFLLDLICFSTLYINFAGRLCRTSYIGSSNFGCCLFTALFLIPVIFVLLG
ncbi:hypothetical protein KFK09_028695 [Dendrobium nobile]|uniref:Uncharacterized protein n=1 Tax=Dendrobium nobile TaxID=94219 RepID=A0A8T3A3C6_DENNO|nr:hypothetical protein KFK09_028695 [Dendrobium nobile]